VAGQYPTTSYSNMTSSVAKHHYHDNTNTEKGVEGEIISPLMEENLRKWLVIATIFLFWQKLGLFFVKYLRFFAVLDKKQFC
jgi:hypothetical protein